MKIVLISHYALPHQGGIEFVTHEIANRLTEMGHVVVHISSDIDQQHSHAQHTMLYRHIGIPAVNVLERFGIPYPFFDPIRLISVVNRELNDADVVHTHGLLYMSCVIGGTLANRCNVGVVVTEHAGFVEYKQSVFRLLEHFAFQTLGRLSCKQSQIITVLNDRIANEIKTLVKIKPIHKIYNGVNTKLFKPASSDERQRLRKKWQFNRPTVLFVGRLVEKKGVHLLPQITNAAFDLVICGRGSLSFASETIRIVQPLPQIELLELYQAADVLIMPSEGEGFPLVVQEALACGLPVIVTDDSVNHEYLNEMVAVFAKRDSVSFLSAILTLLENPEQRRELADNGRTWAVNHFDWSQTTNNYLKLYQEAKLIASSFRSRG